MTLGWDPNPEPNIAGYILRYGLASGRHIVSTNVGNVTSHTVNGLAAGVTYYFVITAYNTAGTEGDVSNEVAYTPSVMLKVNSSGIADVPLQVEPVDQRGAGHGTTPVVRAYQLNTRVTLQAPTTTPNGKFVKWLRNGMDLTTQRRITIALGSDLELTAVYEDDSLKAHWPLSERTGRTSADVSGHGNAIELMGGASWGTSSGSGGVIRFDGQDDYLQAHDHASIDFSSGAFTLALWLQTTQSAHQTLVHKRSSQLAGQFLISLNRNPELEGAVSIFDGDRAWLDSRSRNFADGTWHHLAVTYNGQTLRIYRDGLVDSALGKSVAFQTARQPLNVGLFSSFSGHHLWPFAGQMDDVRIYSRALTAAQIQALMSVNPGGESAPTSLASLREGPLRLRVSQVPGSETIRLSIVNDNGDSVEDASGVQILFSEDLASPISQWTPVIVDPEPSSAQWLLPTNPGQRFFRLKHED